MGLMDIAGVLGGGSAGIDEVKEGYRKARKKVEKYSKLATAEFNPYIEFGKGGMSALETLFANPSSVKDTPGYQFRFDQGQEALQNSAAAKGQLFGGNTLTSLVKYGQDYATGEYDKEINRLFSRVGFGYNASAAKAGIFQNTGSELASLYVGAGRDAGSMEAGAAARGMKVLTDAGSNFIFGA